MILKAHLRNSGIPALGLTPNISVWDILGNAVVSTQPMNEVAGGFYTYDFTSYDNDSDYCILVDGGGTLTDTDRYTTITVTESVSRDTLNNTVTLGHDVTFIRQIESGRWKIEDNQMLFYGPDSVATIATFNLLDSEGNPTLNNVFERVPSHLEMVDDLEMTDDTEML